MASTNQALSRLLSPSTQVLVSTPQTSQERRNASLNDKPINVRELVSEVANGSPSASETVLYLGYGSNLSAETFRGKRGIQPISQVNVVAPQLRLTFNLPGIPYNEPCFANTEYRDPVVSAATAATKEQQRQPCDYHKDRWAKGLVGVVYEVTKADYAHIIATEGGGSGYQDIVVDCYALSSNANDKVPSDPSGNSGNAPFKAHTLFASDEDHYGIPNRQHSYAQPSARYLKLITDGAAEHSLPYEYRAYIDQIRPFRITSLRQRMGQAVFLIVWAPLFFFLSMGLGKIFARPDGTYPEWLVRLQNALFATCWASYDGVFKPLFGDGERTSEDTVVMGGSNCGFDPEKLPLIRKSRSLSLGSQDRSKSEEIV